jgi:two-component system CheB/CheR fusion protein
MNKDTKPTRKALRVLVVDDNADSAKMLSTMLEIEGHEAHVRFDGLEAVEAAASLGPDVVFMDIGLPGLNGFEAAERIRTNPANNGMTLVAITGWGQDQDRQRSKDAGFNVHLVKPVPIKSLKELLAGIAPRERD